MNIIGEQLQKRLQVVEEQLEKQLQDYYCHDKDTQVIIIDKDNSNSLVSVFFDNDLFDNVLFNKTEENKVFVEHIVSNRIKRVFDLMYDSDDILNCQFSFRCNDFSFRYNNNSNSYLTLLVKDDIENIENIVEKLFNTIIIVLSKDTILCDEDIEIYIHKRSILDAVSEFNLLKLAYDNGINDGEYYNSDLPDLALNSYINDVNNVLFPIDKTLTIEDFKKFCLLLDKEYDIILGVR